MRSTDLQPDSIGLSSANMVMRAFYPADNRAGEWGILMSVEIKHACDECMYIVKQYYDEDKKGAATRYIVLDTDEMKQLSKLLKEAGFR